MTHNIKPIKLFLLSAATSLLAGCAAHNDGRTITVEPSPCAITADSANRAMVDVALHVPGHYVASRSRVVIQPQLIVADTVAVECSPVALYSPIYNKKVERRRVLYSQEPLFEGRVVKLDHTSHDMQLQYSEQLQMPDSFHSARLVAVVSIDGCGECTGIDTIDVAEIAAYVPPKRELKIEWIEPVFKIRPKVMEGKGVARLQFAVNKHDINPSMGNNRRELDDIKARLAPVLNDSLATLTSLKIFGMASADGPLALNTTLSRNRALAAKKWLVEQLAVKPTVERLISVGSRPEGWQPVLDAMEADGHPGASKMKEIMQRYADQNDDVAERYIRRQPFWKDICAKYLQHDRKVEYVYTYTLRSFTTDDELLDMYAKRPDAFNEDELLRVATLAATDEERKRVYLSVVKRFPQSAVGANNLAVLYLREGNEQMALATLKAYTADDRFSEIIGQQQ